MSSNDVSVVLVHGAWADRIELGKGDGSVRPTASPEPNRHAPAG